MHHRVIDFLEKRYQSQPGRLKYFSELWDAHRSAGLANKHFAMELTSGDGAKFAQRVWEMLLARHLAACGHNITSRPEGQPDFRFEHGGRAIWVEATSPEPGPDLPRGLPFTGSIVPHSQRLLRWTAALAAKSKKGVEYRRKNVVKPDDAYVIAIDGGQLGWHPLTHGASQMLPYVAEASLAIGPLAFRVDEETGRFLGTMVTVMPATFNHNNASVPTAVFFDPNYSHISALIGCVPPEVAVPKLPVQIVYNPLADVTLAPGLFGNAAEEWTAKVVARGADWQDWDIIRI
ncbi:hypothetical protein D3227_29930 [Mesorhizobium waimense]|uniref:Uncharacterized protein n=1 Tax=Mesorhizobium waimense TaxID=1300307 RepID=A0A3A5K8Y4_9HYPH|nr:hypothetical protein [Mesorhizobium waimense]RJT30820.1 hypothetical protein D3227_29930 [Mesorhizobium waimense]